MSENKVSTTLYKINFKYLIDHCLDKEMWKKSWTIYDYDDCKVNLTLSTINVRDNYIILRVKSNARTYQSYSVDIPLQKDHFNESVFNASVFRAISSCLRDEEQEKIRRSDAYSFAQSMDSSNDQKNEDWARNRCADLGIDDKDIITAYVDAYVSDHSTSYTSSVLERLYFTFDSKRFAMLAYQFEKECPRESQSLLKQMENKFEDEDIEKYKSVVEKAFEMIYFEEMEDIDDAIDSAREKIEEEQEE